MVQFFGPPCIGLKDQLDFLTKKCRHLHCLICLSINLDGTHPAVSSDVDTHMTNM